MPAKKRGSSRVDKKDLATPGQETEPMAEASHSRRSPEVGIEALGEAGLPESAQEISKKVDAGTQAQAEIETEETSCEHDKEEFVLVEEEENLSMSDIMAELAYDSQASVPSPGDVDVSPDHDTQELIEEQDDVIPEGVAPKEEGVAEQGVAPSPSNEEVTEDRKRNAVEEIVSDEISPSKKLRADNDNVAPAATVRGEE